RPPSRRRSSSTRTRAPRPARRTAALSPANPAPMTMASNRGIETGLHPQPGGRGNGGLPDPRDANPAGEHVVAGPLDPAQEVAVETRHDLGRHQRPPLAARETRPRPRVVLARPRALERQQVPYLR